MNNPTIEWFGPLSGPGCETVRQSAYLPLLCESPLLSFGSAARIEATCAVRPSVNNEFNPDLTKDVRWGDQTWEEMMIGFWGPVVERSVAPSQE